MILRHATLKGRLASILRHGLLCSKSRGRLKAVWLHSPAASTWATIHTVKRHGGRVEDVVILEVRVPRRQLRRGKRRLWYSTADVRPEQILSVVTFAQLAGTSQD